MYRRLSDSISRRLSFQHPDHLPIVTIMPASRLVDSVLFSRTLNVWVELVSDLWEYQEYIYMANTRFNVEFVNLRLTADDKPKFVAWADDNAPDLGTLLDNMVGSGYKMSMNLDSQNDCYIVAVTGTGDARDNKGLCMTSRADDLVEALMMAVYKHVVLCNSGSWGKPEDRSLDWG